MKIPAVKEPKGSSSYSRKYTSGSQHDLLNTAYTYTYLSLITIVSAHLSIGPK
jgi:hypothetical protein